MAEIISFYTLKKRIMKRDCKEIIKQLEIHPATNYELKEAEDLADLILDTAGYSNLSGAIPIVTINKNFEIVTMSGKNMPSDISGNIFIGSFAQEYFKHDKVIIVGENEEFFHQRFVIAHELGHYLLDYIGTDAYWRQKDFSKTYPKSNHHDFYEQRADRFAAELLMPKNVFIKEYMWAVDRSDYDLSYIYSYLSEFFQTKKTSVIRRIDEIKKG